MAISKRLRINVTGTANKYGGVDKFSNTMKPVSADKIIAIVSDDRGTVLKLSSTVGDLVVGETLEDLVRDSVGELIKLSPVGFEDMRGGEDHTSRGDIVAVNPDMIAFKFWRKGGSVIRIEGVERGILVRETPRQIEALIDA